MYVEYFDPYMFTITVIINSRRLTGEEDHSIDNIAYRLRPSEQWIREGVGTILPIIHNKYNLDTRRITIYNANNCRATPPYREFIHMVMENAPVWILELVAL